MHKKKLNTVTRFLRRLLVFAGVWALLLGDDASSWFLGVPVALAMASWRLGSSSEGAAHLRLWRLLVFVPFFMWRSLLGSCDVAWRALHVRMPIDPVIYRYSPQLPSGSPATVMFADCINLLPGTLTASWEDGMLCVHVLTESQDVFAELQELERQIALLFGHEWSERGQGSDA